MYRSFEGVKGSFAVCMHLPCGYTIFGLVVL